MHSREEVARLAELAAVGARHLVEPLFSETAKEVLVSLARNPNLSERDLLRLLERKDLDGAVIREIAGRRETATNYSLKLALTRHPRTPRLVSLPLLKFLYLFDLLKVCQTPAVPAHVKVVAEEIMLQKVETIPRGEKITLARMAPGRVAAALLVTEDRELIVAALASPFLLEAQVLRVLALDDLPSAVVESLAVHPKWSRQYHIRLALIRNPKTPLPRVLGFIPDMALNDLRVICLDRRMPPQVRNYILAHCTERLAKKPATHPTKER